MKIVIFAGGTGRRLWPISRQSSPKQFEPIIEGKSTVQLALRRLTKSFSLDDVFVSTNERYISILKDQIPDLPDTNFISEPVRRDLAAAVGLSMVHLSQMTGPDERVGIVWGDNYMTKPDTFLTLLAAGDEIVGSGQAKMAFIGETPRFANNNLGWIGLGAEQGTLKRMPYFSFESWAYRPDIDLCQEMFDSGNFVWNTGYFVTTIGFVVELYKKYQPTLWADLELISGSFGTEEYSSVLTEIYSGLQVESFDDAIVQHIKLDQAVVLHGDTGWSDPGTLYALKESVNPDPENNVVRGLVKEHNSVDSLLYNYEEGKLLAAVGLEGMIVVNTDDAILVVHKDHISSVKELVNDFIGTDLEKYA